LHQERVKGLEPSTSSLGSHMLTRPNRYARSGQ